MRGSRADDCAFKNSARWRSNSAGAQKMSGITGLAIDHWLGLSRVGVENIVCMMSASRLPKRLGCACSCAAKSCTAFLYSSRLVVSPRERCSGLRTARIRWSGSAVSPEASVAPCTAAAALQRKTAMASMVRPAGADRVPWEEARASPRHARMRANRDEERSMSERMDCSASRLRSWMRARAILGKLITWRGDPDKASSSTTRRASKRDVSPKRANVPSNA
mmetsp:Transcript_11719/g.37577  ORF Transcript_11719/g.37577 Transcript_11719/m.37577 type:complete len:221 (+) Transcript_11719:260-922(+)